MLIPYIWRQRSWHPVLVDTNTDCDSTVKIQYVPDDQCKVCVDGKRYYLLQPPIGNVISCFYSGDHWVTSANPKTWRTWTGSASSKTAPGRGLEWRIWRRGSSFPPLQTDALVLSLCTERDHQSCVFYRG